MYSSLRDISISIIKSISQLKQMPNKYKEQCAVIDKLSFANEHS